MGALHKKSSTWRTVYMNIVSGLLSCAKWTNRDCLCSALLVTENVTITVDTWQTGNIKSGSGGQVRPHHCDSSIRWRWSSPCSPLPATPQSTADAPARPGGSAPPPATPVPRNRVVPLQDVRGAARHRRPRHRDDQQPAPVIERCDRQTGRNPALLTRYSPTSTILVVPTSTPESQALRSRP